MLKQPAQETKTLRSCSYLSIAIQLNDFVGVKFNGRMIQPKTAYDCNRIIACQQNLIIRNEVNNGRMAQILNLPFCVRMGTFPRCRNGLILCREEIVGEKLLEFHTIFFPVEMKQIYFH